MHFVDYLILLIPLIAIIGLALYSRRYVRGVADFLAAGRVAGRYVISVGDLQTSLSVMTLVALCENNYLVGISLTFWGSFNLALVIFLSLTGYVLYRYRETKSLSLGQFLETRYNRPIRVIAASIRTIAEMMTNAIGPAVASRFFIYFLGLPITVNICGVEVATFVIVMMLVLSLALVVILAGGRISLLVTDALQGIMSYPIFVILACYILSEISWANDIAPVMLDRVRGESFINPMDIQKLRDFNLFSTVVFIIGNILNRGAWIGNDTSGSGKNAHEQKMAGILGAWRNGFSTLMMTLVALFLITVMVSNNFRDDAKVIRHNLISKVSEEIIVDKNTRANIIAKTNAVVLPEHRIGIDTPYSRDNNPDTPYLNATKDALMENADLEIAKRNLEADSVEASQIKGEHNFLFQKFNTLYQQMMMPVLLNFKLPAGIMGLFLLLMVMLMLSTDDSRIFNASSTLIQDVVMPFRKKPFEKEQHLAYLKWMSVAVCVFFLFVSIFFSQLDYIVMFINIMTSLWLGAAGPIMLGGLYTKWGNSTGAACALIFGSGTSFLGLMAQRNWADVIYPWLTTTGFDKHVIGFFNGVNNLCAPIIQWNMSDSKFPINSVEIYFLAMVLGCIAYVIGSLVTYKKPFNLERMLHRGVYADSDSVDIKEKWTLKNAYRKLIGITPEYTTGDKVIAWSAFCYSIVFQIGVAFVGVLIWNMISPWDSKEWLKYFYITVIVIGLIIGIVSTIWFLIGGFIDIKQLFKDLEKRVDNPLDDGWVDGEVSRVDKELFEKKLNK